MNVFSFHYFFFKFPINIQFSVIRDVIKGRSLFLTSSTAASHNKGLDTGDTPLMKPLSSVGYSFYTIIAPLKRRTINFKHFSLNEKGMVGYF